MRSPTVSCINLIIEPIKKILTFPKFYDFLQSAIGGDNLKKIYNSYLDFVEIQSILDIGAGTSSILEFIPEKTRYVGIEPSLEYCNEAEKKWKGRFREFIAGRTETIPHLGKKFDAIILLGVIHHVSDEELSLIFQFCREHLATSGFVLTVDPTYIDKQGVVSKFLVSSDRGKYVRDFGGYKKLLEENFREVVLEHRNDLLNVPYDHCVGISRL